MKKGLSLLLSLIMVLGVITSMPLSVNAASALNEDLIESEHYVDTSDDTYSGTWQINKPDAKRIAITFSELTYVSEPGYIKLYDENGLVGEYVDSELAGKRIVVFGELVKISLHIDYYVSNYGFALTSVEVFYEDCEHTKTFLKNQCDMTCTNDGYTGSVYCADCGIYLSSGETTPACHNFVDNICTKCKKTADTEMQFKLNADGLSYSLIGCYDNVAGEIHIPEQHNNLPVTSIAKEAFLNQYKITSVALSNNIKKIGISAFENCRGLESINFSTSAIDINRYAFSGCDKLNSVYISNLSSWCNSTFDLNSSNPLEYADNLYINDELVTDVVIPNGITKIPRYCFSCKNITSITIPDSVTNIGVSAFYNCSNLTSVVIPDSVTYIGNSAFFNCDMLKSIKLPDKLTEISSGVLENCDSLITIEIPNSVKHIGFAAFERCSNLVAVKIPDGVETISESAFAWCESLISVIIPNSVTSIGCNAFNSCKSLKTVVIGNGVKNIETESFRYCTNLKDITIGNSVVSIGESAFENCGSIESIIIPDSVTTIEASSFYSCENLTSVTIPANVTYIGVLAFGFESFFEKIDGFTIYGKHETEAEKYADRNGFVFIDPTHNHSSSSWITDKKATVNTSGKKHKECTECGEVLETATIKQLKCSKPKLKSIENTEYGVLTKWGKVSGADKYYVYRKTGSKGKYSKIATTTKTYYTDKKAKSGKKYYYIVKAVNEAGNSSSSSSLSKYYLADTTLKTPSSKKSGITLKWSKVTGADGYMVYRKTGSGSYSKIATVKGSTKVTYTDKKAKKGKTYTYKVKAYKSKTYSAYSNTKKIKDKY